MSTAGRTELVLIRHAHARISLTGIIGGHRGDTGLTPLGRQQADALRARLTATCELRHATTLIASSMRRAVETAEIIAPAIGSGVLSVEEHCAVCELHPGVADGLPRADWLARYGIPRWQDDLDLPFAPGGESLLEHFRRATAALRKIADAHSGELVVIVTHGAVIEYSIVDFLGLPLAYRQLGLDPTLSSLTRWSKAAVASYPSSCRRVDAWKLDTYNDIAHLAWAKLSSSADGQVW